MYVCMYESMYVEMGACRWGKAYVCVEHRCVLVQRYLSLVLVKGFQCVCIYVIYFETRA